MVARVHDEWLVAARTGELGSRLGGNDVVHRVRTRWVIRDRRSGRWVFRRVPEVVLLKGTAEADVDQLEAAADAEAGYVVRERALKERELDGVAALVDVGRGDVVSAIALRVDVPATGEAQPIELIRHGVGRIDRDRLGTRTPDGVEVLIARDDAAARSVAAQRDSDPGSHPCPWYSV